MSEQIVINLPEQRRPNRAADFEKFDRENPTVYTELVRLTRELVAEGHEKIGFELVYNVARWVLRTRTTTETAGTFRLNDVYGCFYARKIMGENADLRFVFDTRKAPDADAWAAANYPQRFASKDEVAA